MSSKIDQVEVREASEEECEEADFVVCVRADEEVEFSDNEFGICSKCGCRVQFRPHAPKGPPKVCYTCISAIVAADSKPELIMSEGAIARMEALRNRKS